MTLHIYKILPYLFIALIALPLPILMLLTPVRDFYGNVRRKRRIHTIHSFYDRPFELSEKQISELFPGINGGSDEFEDFEEEDAPQGSYSHQ
jgi:hypothetical protein